MPTYEDETVLIGSCVSRTKHQSFRVKRCERDQQSAEAAANVSKFNVLGLRGYGIVRQDRLRLEVFREMKMPIHRIRS